MTNEDIKKLESAIAFSHAAHDSINQKRKYTGEPYWVHTDEVYSIVAEVTDDVEVLIAALFHDILEDVKPIHPEWSKRIFIEYGYKIYNLVLELTDAFTKEAYPEFNREQRKLLERTRISLISSRAKTIKLGDLISNSKSIVEHDKDFARIYLKEKELLLPYLKDGNEKLWNEANNQ